MTLHERLRDATRPEHRLIDLTLSRLDLACPDDYGAFLRIHFEALQRLVPSWRTEDRPDFGGLLDCLEDDLDDLGLRRSSLPRSVTGRPASLRSWGVGYVIRGSRLGGRVLRQRVPAGAPTSYLDFMPGLSWPNFLRHLDDITSADRHGAAQQAQIIRGAKTTFSVFARAAVTAGLSSGLS